jgi:transposase
VRLYGRALKGERAVGQAPYGRWEQLTIFGGRSLDGLIACMALDGAAATEAVVAFAEQVLVPALRPGQVAVLDHLSPHRAARVRAVIETAGGRLLCLPPYSPDFTPIAHAWSTLKTLLRGMGARTRAALEAALGTALDTALDAFTTADAHGWFAHCGYGSSH